jgi:hypothetical protein
MAQQEIRNPGQQQSDLELGVKRAVGQRRTAGRRPPELFLEVVNFPRPLDQ